MNEQRAASSEQLHGVFIAVEVEDAVANDDGNVKVVRENLDECVLCNLCVEAAPPGCVVVKKLYDGTELRR
jgi:formate hydrogenlyase subunit 6/NADH:ubiquinone oxidoreductase subunit I